MEYFNDEANKTQGAAAASTDRLVAMENQFANMAAKYEMLVKNFPQAIQQPEVAQQPVPVANKPAATKAQT